MIGKNESLSQNSLFHLFSLIALMMNYSDMLCLQFSLILDSKSKKLKDTVLKDCTFIIYLKNFVIKLFLIMESVFLVNPKIYLLFF